MIQMILGEASFIWTARLLRYSFDYAASANGRFRP